MTAKTLLRYYDAINRRLSYVYLKKVKSFKCENSICIIADPRGGSTWLAELLSHVPKSTVLNEPLHLSKDRYQYDRCSKVVNNCRKNKSQN